MKHVDYIFAIKDKMGNLIAQYSYSFRLGKGNGSIKN
jgi:hypothetical protein